METIDFDAARREGGGKPLRFKLGGATFNAKPKVSFAWLMAAADRDRNVRSYAERFANSRQFVLDVLATDADRKRFDKVLNSLEDPITEDDLYAVVTRLVGEYSARPTRPSAVSSAGRRRNGAASSNGHTATSQGSKRGS